MKTIDSWNTFTQDKMYQLLSNQLEKQTASDEEITERGLLFDHNF
ncbi:hypothetical protein [Candidatus Mycoplasma mahonii]|nr:hypothetical protein [Candidatus Mycoplasma mahonii]WKX02275.1 hypothetical protein O3I44_02625 [Candidatus Mycoplasma mahonii]